MTRNRFLQRMSPFLLAMYPLVFFYSVNFYQIGLDEILPTIAVSLLLTAVVLAVWLLVLRNTQRALFVSSVIVLLFFAYGRVFEVTQHIRLRFFPFDKHPGLLALWGILAAAGIAFAVRFPRRLPGINWVVGLFASLLLIVSFAEIGVKAATNSAPPLPVYEAALDVSAPDVLPDIYFIVLDEYAGNRALLDYLGYDNSEFTDSLRDRGFYVADAHANYYATRFSLASILNMHYLDSLYGHRGEDPEPVIAQVRDNVTIQTLKRLGYTYVHFNSGSRVTRDNPFVDILYDGYDEQRIRLGDLLEIDPKQFHITDFHITLGQTTLLRPLMEMEQLRDSRSRVLFSLEKLTELPRMPEPTFAFAHLALPHPPYVFGRDEGPVNPDRPVDGQIVDEALYQAHAGYIDQVIYTNRAISQLVDTILEQSATEPIILIQADHGFRWLCSDCLSESKAWDDAYYSDVVLPILSAYYLPDGGDSQLYPTMSPVNTFRVIFDHYFGADLVLLEDRYFRPEDYFTRPYFFIDITHRVVASRNLN